jgi:hypothetical protein
MSEPPFPGIDLLQLCKIAQLSVKPVQMFERRETPLIRTESTLDLAPKSASNISRIWA